PGARLDPPLLLALDEIGNLAPLPSLPTLMAEGGGTGITTLPVLQSLAQARQKWSENQAGAIWDAAIVKIILGGASNSRDLQDLSTLIGERDEVTDSITLGDHGTRSNQRSIRRVPILPPDRVRTLPFGTGVVLLRSAPPIITDLRAWPTRSDANQLSRDRGELELLLERPPRQ
uniref:type IV secretory system conjugative DNA transfer family protein n=1 Tax=Galactobacter sp. TaxID=2676125 RepID=UPI0025B7D224